jgi:prophage maintenance system killer protein
MATKKISELPLVNAVSGSQVAGGSVIPIVIGTGIQGTTNQISVENFSKFVTAYSAHTGSAGNVFTGPQTINNNVTINGRLTVTEVVAQYETASILFSTGSTKLGDQLTDKHEFTGSTNLTGSFIANGFVTLNGQSLNNAFDRIHQATQSLQAHSASVDNQLARVYQTTQSLHVATASLNAFTASQDSRNFTIALYTASLEAQLARVYQTTQSLHVATASLNNFTASQDSRNFVISQYTASTDAHIVGISDFTSSQLAVNLANSIYTASVDNHIVGISDFTSSQLAVNLGNSIYTASVDSHIVGISTYTSSVRDTLARIHQTTQSLQVATASIQIQTASLLAFTASQDGRNFVVSQVTGSLIGITNGLMAFTAALDNTYATDAQLYQLYQATRSIELHSGSMIGVTNGLMAYTASNTNLNAGLRGEVDGIESYTASLKAAAIVSSSTQVQNYDIFALNSNVYTSTGSLIGITNGLMAYTSSNETWKTGIRGEISGIEAWTASLDNTFATDAQLLPILQATRSIELTTGSLIGITNGLMAFTAALDSTYATDAQLYQLYAETASIKAEIAGIEALTASFKAASIVSSSTQIQNYNVFAQTASVNTFYGNQFITGGLNVNNGITGSLLGNVNGNATTATTANLATNAGNIAVVRDNTDTTLYPVFTSTTAADTYYSLKGHASGTLYYNGLTQQLIVSGGGLVVTGSLNVTGSITIASGSIAMPNRPAFRIIGTGGEVLAPYVLSGSKVSVDYNQANHFNTTNGLFTAPIAGLYQVNLVIRTNSNTNSTINQAIVYKQSSAIDTAQIMVEFGANTTMNHSGGSTITKLEVGDTLRAQVVVGTCSFDGNDNFSVAYIG